MNTPLVTSSEHGAGERLLLVLDSMDGMEQLLRDHGEERGLVKE